MAHVEYSTKIQCACSKQFPKDFCTETRDSINGYPMYRRRDNGMTADVRGHTIDNRYVVPYNPYLLAKFECHLNVEVCTTVKSVKYIYKYVYKGYDCATVELETNEANANLQVNEIQNFLNGRYVGSTESISYFASICIFSFFAFRGIMF